MRAEAELGPVRDTGPAPRKPRRLRFILLLLGAVVALTAALAVLDARRAAGDVRTGRAAFRALVDRGLIAEGQLHTQARAAAAHATSAERRVRGSPWLRAWSRVPVLGRPARWLRAATGVAASLSERASDAVGRIEASLESLRDAPARLSFLTLVEHEFAELLRSVDAVRLPGSGGFLPPVDAARKELTQELRQLHDGLSRGVASVRGLRAFLEGPTNYLVLAANNAEMRAGGMVLQAGLLNARDGVMSAGGFRTTADLMLRDPVTLPREFEALYGWLDPGVEWRNVGSSPNFPVVAPIYGAMAQRRGVRNLDGVLQLDVIGVRELLRVIGPVQIEGTRFDASNVDRLVLHDLYITFGGRQFERRAEFSRLAAATFTALNERSWRPADMVRALRFAAAGRHLLVWSSHAEQQAAWRGLGVDGALPRDGFMLTVQNHTGNKLDWYVRPSVAMDVESLRGGARRVRARITIANPTPPGPAGYVNGDGSLVPVGGYRALVAVYLPGWATDVEMPGSTVNIVGPDGSMRVIGTRVDILRGRTVTLDVAFTVPATVRGITLLSSARAVPVLVTIDEMAVNDAVRRAIVIPMR